MTYQQQKNFTFVSDAYPEDTFSVVRFRGTEGISKLYEFDITLTSDDPDIDSRSVIQNPATFTIVTPDAELPISGIMARFEHLQEVDDNIFYRGVLVPRFWQSTLSHDNELFLEKNVEGIIEEILAQTGLTSSDFDIRLTADYPTWEYICQYHESDFNFVSRRMEREGIYYYFEQADNGEKLIITDSSTSHEDIAGNASVNYVPPAGQVPSEADAVRSLTSRQQILPARVVLRDYNYRRPTLDLRGEADVDADGGRGTVYIYGEHFKTPEEGNFLARVRAEGLICRQQVFQGEGTVATFRPGYLFELSGHVREGYNQRYLIVDVTHRGRQTRHLSQGTDEGAESRDEGPGYVNQFTAIPADVQYRPERDTPRPRFNGTLNATIDAASDGQYAEIDDLGRYKVILPFDQSGNAEGKASRWVRMAQPYAGANYGMHFPLHKGAEVLLTFVDGDPDRPIISGSVPNPDTMSPVTGGNQTSSVIRTGGGNQLRIEDSDGGQQIHLSSPTQGSVISLGAPNEGNIYFKTAGNQVIKVDSTKDENVKGDVTVKYGGSETIEVTGGVKITYHNNAHTITHGDITEETYGNKDSTTKGNTTEKFNGDKVSTVGGSTTETFTGFKDSSNRAATSEAYYGVKHSRSLAATNEIFVGIKTSYCAALTLERSNTHEIREAPLETIKGKARIHMESGGTSITITPGNIDIHCSSGVVIRPGPKLEIYGDTKIIGSLKITKGLDMDGDFFAKGNVECDGFLSNPNFASSS